MSTRTQSDSGSYPLFAERGHTDFATAAWRLFDNVLDFVDRAVLRISAPERSHPVNDARLNTTFDAARALRQMRVRAKLTEGEFADVLGLAESRLVLIEIGEAGCLETLQTCQRARAILDQARQRETT